MPLENSICGTRHEEFSIQSQLSVDFLIKAVNIMFHLCTSHSKLINLPSGLVMHACSLCTTHAFSVLRAGTSSTLTLICMHARAYTREHVCDIGVSEFRVSPQNWPSRRRPPRNFPPNQYLAPLESIQEE